MAKERLRFREFLPKGRLEKKQDRPEIARTRSETGQAAREAAETLDSSKEIKGLLCEMYDKVNIAVFLYREQQDRGIHTPVAFQLERSKMLQRYLYELYDLGADQKDYAKFLAMWQGDIDPKNLDEYDGAARDLRIALDHELNPDPVIREIDPMKILSAPEEFALATKARWGTYREDKQGIEFSIRNGFPMTFGVYTKIMDFVAFDPEHEVHPGRLVQRSARELADLSSLYRGYGNDGYMTSGLFEKVAAVFLHMYKSSFVNAFNDQYLRKICRMILEGATERQFLTEIKRLRPLPSMLRAVPR